MDCNNTSVIQTTMAGSNNSVIHATMDGSNNSVIHATMDGSNNSVIHATMDGSNNSVIHATMDSNNSVLHATMAGSSKNSVIVCLGLELLPSGSMDPMLLTRCDTAADLHNDTGVVIVNTGGDPAQVGVTEAEAMRRYMVEEKGVEEGKIVEEAEANDTLENALNVLNMMERDVGKVYLVTNEFHMPRAAYIFKAAMQHCGWRGELDEVAAKDPAEGRKKLLEKEKRIMYFNLTKLLSLKPVMGRRSGHNVAMPSREVVKGVIRRIDDMLEQLKE